MKIALLIPSNIAGGAERVLTSLANQFAREEIATYFISFEKGNEFYKIDKRVHKRSLAVFSGNSKGLKKYRLFPKYYKELMSVMTKINPDIVVSFLFLTNVIGIACCNRLHIPIIISERNDPNEYSKKQRIIMKLFYPKVNGFVCQSDVINTWVRKTYRITNAVTIINPLNKHQFGEIKDIKQDKIISVGRLVPQKNYELLIDAFAVITQEYPNIDLEIYGEGFLRQKLENRIKKYGLEKKVVLPGVEKDVIKRHNDARLFVLTSKYEGYPNVVAEAIANGIICVAPDVASGTVKQIIKNGENGYLFKVDDKEELIKCMKKSLDSEVDLKKLKLNAQNIYNISSIELIASKWLNYIKEIIKEGKLC